METEPSFPKRESRRVLGLDMGAKRIGLVVSDPLGVTAQGPGGLDPPGPAGGHGPHLLKVGRDYAVQQIVVACHGTWGRLGGGWKSWSLQAPWARVWRGETETLEKMEKRVEYDLDYLRRWSLWFDLKIILLTIFRSFKDSHAY